MRVAFITGASRNIGRAMALQLADAGHAVAINARDEERIASVVKEIQDRGGQALACPADVTDRAAITAAIAKAEKEFGSVDILVNNAVIRAHGAIEDSEDEHWNEVLSVIIMGAVNCTRAVVPGMRSRGWGRIINMAGVSGQKGGMHRASIVTAKSGIIGFTKAVALEVAADGITVNALSPGLINTEERRVGLGERETNRNKTGEIPAGRMGRPDEVASAAVYLCSDGAGFITGQVIGITGGMYM